MAHTAQSPLDYIDPKTGLPYGQAVPGQGDLSKADPAIWAAQGLDTPGFWSKLATGIGDVAQYAAPALTTAGVASWLAPYIMGATGAGAGAVGAEGVPETIGIPGAADLTAGGAEATSLGPLGDALASQAALPSTELGSTVASSVPSGVIPASTGSSAGGLGGLAPTGPAATGGGPGANGGAPSQIQPWQRALSAFSQQQASNSANALKGQQNEQQIQIEQQAQQQTSQAAALKRLRDANATLYEPTLPQTTPSSELPPWARMAGFTGPSNPMLPGAAQIAANAPGAKAAASQATSQLQSGSAFPSSPATDTSNYGPGTLSNIAGYASVIPPSVWKWVASFL